MNKITIKTATENDAVLLANLRKQLFTETNFMLFEPGEFNPSENEAREFVSMFYKSNKSNILTY